MRTLKIVPPNLGQPASHLWSLVAIEEDDSEVTVEEYPTLGEAEAAKAALERRSLQPPE
jgi:hypothetical protein